jgi:tetratricopeptide (TPR) repeat protein
MLNQNFPQPRSWLPLLLAALLVMNHGSEAQPLSPAGIDSLSALLPGLPRDTNKVKLLNRLSLAYYIVDPDKGILTGVQGLTLAERLNWKKGMADAYNSLGGNYWAKKDFVRAQDSYLRALEINESRKDSSRIGRNVQNLATVYVAQNNFSKALEYDERALVIAERVGENTRTEGLLVNIADLYTSMNNSPKAVEYYQRSLDLARRIHDLHQLAYASGQLGLIYEQHKDHTRALALEESSLTLFRQLKDTLNMAGELAYIGNLYLDSCDYLRSIGYLETASTLYTRITDITGRGGYGRCLGTIGHTYLLMATQKNGPNGISAAHREMLMEKATGNLLAAISIYRMLSDWEGLKSSLGDLSQIQAMHGQYAAALETYKQFDLYKDSLYNSVKDKEMLRRELDYEYDNKRDSLNYLQQLQTTQMRSLKQKEQLNRLTLKQQWLYSLLALILILLFGGYLFYHNRIQQIKLKNELLGITFSAIRSQMNPHFIFNVLNTIQSYVYSNEKKSAIRYLGKFSELIRRILDNSNKELISLEEEIDFLQLYIEMEKERFGDLLHTSLSLEEGIRAEDIMIPPLLIQPYVENAIKHGLLHRMTEKRLDITIGKTAGSEGIRIVIDDNGIGRDTSKEINKNRATHRSFATVATGKRIELINQLHGSKARVKIIDKKNEDGSAAGTTVIIVIPVIEGAMS